MCEWKGIDLPSWEAFENQVSWLRKKREGAQNASPVLNLLFRGDMNPKRNLETSLEREYQQPVTLDEYFKRITIHPEIESVTGTRWEKMPDFDPGCLEWIEKLGDKPKSRVGPPPGYNYLAYLRHHESPSPFLDWTRSPYIAAYFAFAEAKADAEHVSIYAYWEVTGNKADSCPNKPLIVSLGPHVHTHRRHFQQQSEYTFCIVKNNGIWQFAPHDDKVLMRCDGMTEPELDVCLSQGSQDLAWKFNIPASEKNKVLKYLDDRNINGFSLLGTEEGAHEDIGRT